MDKIIAEIHLDVKEVKSSVQKLAELAAVHNHILNEHHKRSTNLEERVKPLEEDYILRSKVWTLVMGSSGIIALLALGISALSYFARR